MKTSRRSFIGTGTALAASLALPSLSFRSAPPAPKKFNEGFDPWIEVFPEAIRYNAKVLFNLAGKRPLMAVIKNNGYGLGDINVAKILDNMPEVVGFAAVKTEACMSIKESGIKKPLLHLGMATDSDFMDLAKAGIQLSVYDSKMPDLLESIAGKLGRSVGVHLYIDTGMSRMGVPWHKALPFIENISRTNKIDILGSFMGFTEEPDYDPVQLKRLRDLSKEAANKKANIGALHAASSNAIFHFPESALDMVRPGISLYGAYPTFPEIEKEIAELKVAYRLNARVVRVENLRAGDSVSYGRKYIADRPVWIATLPVGHADGYMRNAVKGAKVFIKGKLYPVIGTVSASHTILELGDKPTVKVGDIATLVGPDHPEINPSHLSTVTGDSVYDILMHMSARIPKVINKS